MIISIYGCQEQKANTILAEKSKVSKQLYLKELTTGVKPGKELKDGHIGKWSYFGRERVVSHKLYNGMVSTIEVSLGSSWDGDILKRELEDKFTAENGRAVKFTCDSKDSSIAFLKDMPVTEVDCRIGYHTQVLTIHRIFPRYESAKYDFPNLTVMYNHSLVKLVDTKMVSDEKTESDSTLQNRIREDAVKAKADL